MGLVSAGQFLALIWAFRSSSASPWISGAVALFAALHPLWPAGYLQRFLPAQTAALALFIALGFTIRYLQQGRRRTLIATAVSLLIGLAVYPGPALVAILMAFVLAILVPSSWKRKVVVVATSLAVTAAMATYSLLIVRLITPQGARSYEIANVESAGVKSIRELFVYLGGTFVNNGTALVVPVLALAVVSAVLALVGAIPHSAGWLMAGVALVSPIAGAVFFGAVGWLQDIDRIGYTTSLALLVGLAIWPIASLTSAVRLELFASIGLIVVALSGSLLGIARWQVFVDAQHQLLEALAPLVEKTQGENAVVVVDDSGMFGHQYTFPVQYLQGASIVANDDPTLVWLCFPFDGRYPVPSGGITCGPESAGFDLAPAGSLALPSGVVQFYVGTVSPVDFETREFN